MNELVWKFDRMIPRWKNRGTRRKKSPP